MFSPCAPARIGRYALCSFDRGTVMRIDNSALYLAFARMLTGALRYTQDYSPAVLRVAWRRTGLRARDLEQMLQEFNTQGLLRRYRADGGERYQLTVAGSVELYVDHGSWWQRWHDAWLLDRIRRRHREPAARPVRLRRREDRTLCGQPQPAPGDQPGQQRQDNRH